MYQTLPTPKDTVKKARWVKGERKKHQTPAKGLETKHRNKRSVLKLVKIGSKTPPYPCHGYYLTLWKRESKVSY